MNVLRASKELVELAERRFRVRDAGFHATFSQALGNVFWSQQGFAIVTFARSHGEKFPDMWKIRRALVGLMKHVPS